MSIFPIDAKDKEGNPFWSGPKRAPSPIEFDSENELHLNFVVSYANLIAKSLNIPQNNNFNEIKELAKTA